MAIIIKVLKAERISCYDLQMVSSNVALFRIKGNPKSYLERLRAFTPIVEIDTFGKSKSTIREEIQQHREGGKPLFLHNYRNLLGLWFLLSEVKLRNAPIIVGM